MTPQDLCEPVFLYLCRLSRHHRAGVKLSARHTRAELAAILADARARAALAPDLLAQFEHIEPALLACIDHAIRSSGWSMARRWTPGAIAAPDDHADRFFAILRADLDDPTPAADERLEVLASCAALAFAVPNLPEPRRQAIEQLRLRLAAESLGVLSPIAHVNTANLARRSARRDIALVALALSAVAVISAAASFASSAGPPAPPLAHAGATP